MVVFTRGGRLGSAGQASALRMSLISQVSEIRRLAVVGILIQLTTALLSATPIDLNDFFADPPVSVAPDGFSATLAEDAALGFVLLSNDPSLGDPNVILPAPGIFLRFDYAFLHGLGEADEFGAFVIDAATGLSAGPAFELFTQSSTAGSVAFNLTPLTGQTLGLQFQLSSLPGDSGLGSTATVSNVRLDPIPEPSAIALVLSGLLLVGWHSRYPLRR